MTEKTTARDRNSAAVRDAMIAGAEQLLAGGGPAAAAIPRVLALTGAPRGSIYHYFPDGKDELMGCAIEFSDRRMRELLTEKSVTSPFELVSRWFDIWAAVLVRSDFDAGCAITAVVVAGESPKSRQHAAEVFSGQEQLLAETLRSLGVPRADAERLAPIMIASAEGAVILGRAERGTRPIEIMRASVLAQLTTLGLGPSVAGSGV
ncbi:TetR/AcrR family transcriptional regulator [Rhodococcus erythropolis]|uniref:TetR/AcrR family transcriptional regulator n=1 Tax=Rhodococcus erythropolis TaxID=1833 RepID=UPI003671602C